MESVGSKRVDDRIQRYEAGKVNYVQVVGAEGEYRIFPARDAYEFYMEYKDISPNWKNEVTLESLEKVREFDPVSLIHLLSPAALLLIAGEKDNLIPIGEVKKAFARAHEPKSMVTLPITHFEPYKEPWLSIVAGLAADWFKEHLSRLATNQ